MNTESITKAIQEWAGAEPVAVKPAPSGRIHVTIDEPDPFVPAHRASVFFDICPSGKGCTFGMSHEGDDQYTTRGIPEFQTEGRLIRHLRRCRNEFFRDFVYGPRLEQRLEDRGLSYHIPEYDFYITGPDWAFFEYRIYEITDPAGGRTFHVGIHGDGSVATFQIEEEDVLLADEIVDLPEPAAMVDWIEKLLESDGNEGKR